MQQIFGVFFDKPVPITIQRSERQVGFTLRVMGPFLGSLRNDCVFCSVTPRITSQLYRPAAACYGSAPVPMIENREIPARHRSNDTQAPSRPWSHTFGNDRKSSARKRANPIGERAAPSISSTTILKSLTTPSQSRIAGRSRPTDPFLRSFIATRRLD
jgi:hypothetical protein